MLASIFLLVINAAAGFIALITALQWRHVVPQSTRAVRGQHHRLDRAPAAPRRPGMFGLDMASLLPAWVVQVLLGGLRAQPARRDFSSNAAGDRRPGGRGLIELIRMMVLPAVRGRARLGGAVVGEPAFAARALAQRSRRPLRPFRRVVPTIANVDLSPLVLLLGAADRADGARRRGGFNKLLFMGWKRAELEVRGLARSLLARSVAPPIWQRPMSVIPELGCAVTLRHREPFQQPPTYAESFFLKVFDLEKILQDCASRNSSAMSRAESERR